MRAYFHRSDAGLSYEPTIYLDGSDKVLIFWNVDSEIAILDGSDDEESYGKTIAVRLVEGSARRYPERYAVASRPVLVALLADPAVALSDEERAGFLAAGLAFLDGAIVGEEVQIEVETVAFHLYR